jgi:CRP-like cAMP-binding protein
MAKKFPFVGDFKNLILRRLSPECTHSFGDHLQPVDLAIKQNIYQPNEPVRHAYFAELGMMSVVSVMTDGRSIEVGTIGKEGMAGGFTLLHVDSVPYQCFVQIPGHGYRVDVDVLRSEASRNSELHRLISQHQVAFLTQAMQAAACNGLHSVAQRCCRWLLMSQDRSESSEVHLTHEFLGLMLGVRRASVTDVLRPLQERGWIQSQRGEIKILDRAGLESGSCECYRIIRGQQLRD